MANLVKIKDVNFYIGISATNHDQWLAKEMLDTANVKYNILGYHDPVSHNGVFQSLSTWTFGLGESTYKIDFCDFPIVTWVDCYDDFTLVVNAVMGSVNLANSSLIANASLAK